MHNLDHFLAHYEATTNSHNFDEVAPLIAENAVYWFGDGSHIGHAAIRAAFEAAWTVVAEEVYRISDVHWLAAGDGTAACIYRYSWTGLVNGVARSGHGRGTNVLANAGGVWRIVHEHLSAPA
jgi:ketosteroid isomerase-like protein